MMKSVAMALAPLALFASAAIAAPPAWTVVPGKSSIGFSGKHAGNPFNGRFGNWSAAIRFDPKDLANSRANVVIATATATTGDNLQETTLKTAEWFDVGAQPRATFTTRRITAAGPNRYVADGVLTIKGKAVPVTLPFTLSGAGTTLQMRGSVTLDRIALNLGAKSDPNGEWVSKAIVVTVNVVAQRAK